MATIWLMAQASTTTQAAGMGGMAAGGSALERRDVVMRNLIDVDGNDEVIRSLMRYAWQIVRETGDQALLNSHYPILRLAPYGPGILGE